MENVKLLDCTLRDGGHLNQSRFGKEVIQGVVDGLVQSNVDIIELGFLSTEQYDPEYSLFRNIADAKKVIPAEHGDTEFSLMAYRFDVSDLEECDGSVNYIRTTFHIYDFEEGIENCKKIIQKGYKCSVNLINFFGAYTGSQKVEVLKRINDIHPAAISMADTYGLLDLKEMDYLYQLAENTLDKGISIGIHVHENKGISYALAQRFLEIKHPARPAIVDASVYGMGEVPGNLRMELIMDYMNKYCGTRYELPPVYDIIDKYINKFSLEKNWDYALPYAVSSKWGINRKYAEFLMNQPGIGVKDMDIIMAKVQGADKPSYNKVLAKELYDSHMKQKG